MSRARNADMLPVMHTFILHHRHEPAECGIAFAAWRGFESPLRHHQTVGTCSLGGHELWWLVDAPTRDRALAQLPPWLAARTRATRIGEVSIP